MQKLLFFLFSISLLAVSCDTGGDPLGDALLEAAQQGKIDQMKVCVENGVDINYINPNLLSTQMTACSKAAAAGQLEALKWLVKEGADWHKATLGILVKKGLQVRDDLLLLAVTHERANFNKVKATIGYLLNQGVNINAQDGSGDTALHIASKYENDELMNYLIEKGANETITNSRNMTAREVYGEITGDDEEEF